VKRDEERFEEVVGGGAENAAGHHPEHLSEENEEEYEGEFDKTKQLG